MDNGLESIASIAKNMMLSDNSDSVRKNETSNIDVMQSTLVLDQNSQYNAKSRKNSLEKFNTTPQEQKEIADSVTSLFSAFAKNDDINLKVMYVELLKDAVPSKLVKAAVRKLVFTGLGDGGHYGVPYVADVIQEALNIFNEIVEPFAIKPYYVAWHEICRAAEEGIAEGYPYIPVFSISEIDTACALAFSWDDFLRDYGDECLRYMHRLQFIREYDKLCLNSTCVRCMRSWDDAWHEIRKRVELPGNFKPVFSSPAIDELVKKWGWQNILLLESDNMNTTYAQMRNMYNAIADKHRQGYLKKYYMYYLESDLN